MALIRNTFTICVVPSMDDEDVDFWCVYVSAGGNCVQEEPGLLRGYVQSLFDEGIVNDQFSQIQTLKSDEDPEGSVKLINTYFLEVETILSELTSRSELPDVDFSKLAPLARSIEEKSSFIGAEHVKFACADLIQACDQMHKLNFQRALGWIKNEFTHTRNKLDSFIQMERRILRVEGKEVK